MTPEEEVSAVRAALAEAGYPDADVYTAPEDGEPTVRICVDRGYDGGELIPIGVIWRAFAVACPARLMVCWPCFDNPEIVGPCNHDPLTSPWPPVVRPEGVGA